MIKEDRLLEKYNEIWDKVGNTIKNGSGWKPEYNEKYLKTKTKSYERKFNKNFHNDKMPKKMVSLHLPISGVDWVCI